MTEHSSATELPTLTFDIDWAPSWVVEDIALGLIEAEVRSTWFVTHEIEALELLRSRPDLFELGIHPNFQSGSSHGSRPEDVLQHCMELVPDAASVRTHGLMFSTPLLDEILGRTEVRVDASLYLPRALHLSPVFVERPLGTMTRLPYLWEDDLEMGVRDPEWHPGRIFGRGPGLKIIDLHPLHVVMNAVDLTEYTKIKRMLDEPDSVTRELIKDLARSGDGPASLLRQVTEILASNGGGMRISDLANLFSRETSR